MIDAEQEIDRLRMAYTGAREDLQLWKRRAQAAEARLRSLSNMAATGTAQSFLKCDDETKVLFFAQAVMESSDRKEYQRQRDELLAALRPFAAIEVPSFATPGTWVAETKYCNTQVTAASVREAKACVDAYERVARLDRGAAADLLENYES